MGDYFEKLGNLLNEALENGEIPQEKTPDKEKINEKQEDIRENIGSSKDEQKKRTESFRINSQFKGKKPVFATGEVIKMHKYTENMQLSPEVQQALITLDIVYPCNWKDISKQYHKLLKSMHPDTQNTIQNSDNVSKSRQISDIQSAYNLLKLFFNK